MGRKSTPVILFKALGDETRYNLARALLSGERCACFPFFFSG